MNTLSVYVWKTQKRKWWCWGIPQTNHQQGPLWLQFQFSSICTPTKLWNCGRKIYVTVFVEASARTIKQPTSSDISTAFISYFSTYDWTAFSAYIPTYKVFISTSTLSLLHFKTVFVRKRLTSTLAFWGYFYIHLCLRWITCTREKQLSSSLSTFQLAKKKSASQQTSGEEWDRHSWQTKTLFYFQDVWQQNRKARIFLL